MSDGLAYYFVRRWLRIAYPCGAIGFGPSEVIGAVCGVDFTEAELAAQDGFPRRPNEAITIEIAVGVHQRARAKTLLRNRCRELVAFGRLMERLELCDGA